MPTGLTSAWGYPMGALSNQFSTMLQGDHPLTYESSMTSYPPTFPGGIFQSPLTPIANNNNFASQNNNVNFAFGSSISKKVCKLFLKNKSRNPLTGRKIKRSGKVFKNLIKQCEKFNLIKKKKKI